MIETLIWKDEFTKVQTSLAIGSTNYIGIINHVHYVDNQFNFHF